MADEEIVRNSNDAVILNYSQNPVEYQSVPKVWLTHPDSTEENVKLVPFTYGEAVSKSVDVDFSGGDMAVEIPEGELVTELTVKKPEDLMPENIPEGMYIGGVGPGTHVGSGSEDALPQLYAPSIAYTSGVLLQYLTIINPVDQNGAFASALNVSIGDSTANSKLLYNKSLEANTVTLYGKDLLLPDGINIVNSVLGSRLAGNRFNLSEAALTGSLITVLRVTYDLQNLTIEPMYPAAFLNDEVQFQLTAAEGYYLPRSVDSELGVYDADTGKLSVSFNKALAEGYALSLSATLDPWLHRPKVTLDTTAATIAVTFPTDATGVSVAIDGTVVTTVFREEQETVEIDLSSQLAGVLSCTISVVATAEGFADSDVVSVWYLPALIDIDIANNSTNNLGTGGSTYDASLLQSAYLSGGRFIANSQGALSIPTPFMQQSATTPWTIVWAVNKWTPSYVSYSRFARGSSDVPSLFYAYGSNKSNLFKLTSTTVFASQVSWYDSDSIKPWGSSSSNALCVEIPNDARTTIAFRNDGTYISLWVNGEKLVEQAASRYTSGYWASSFTLGNGVTNSYSMSYMECDMLKAWDRALTDTEMTTIM